MENLPGGQNYLFDVIDKKIITSKYISIKFRSEKFVNNEQIFPAKWIRLWVPYRDNPLKFKQKGYTVIEPNYEEKTFLIEFSLHEGDAAIWAERAELGEVIAATVLGSAREIPEYGLESYLLLGDIASLPAIKSIINNTPAEITGKVLLEYQHECDLKIPLPEVKNFSIEWVHRSKSIQKYLPEYVNQIEDSIFPACKKNTFFSWIGCDTETTRFAKCFIREKCSSLKNRIHWQGYWIP